MKQAPFLFSETQFRVVRLEYSSESFGNAIMVLEDKDLRIQFVKDRGQIFLDFQAPTTKHPHKNWFSIDIVKQKITGKIAASSEIIPENIEFLRKNLEEIKDLFSPSKLDDTLGKLDQLQRDRAKRMFSKRKS